MANAARRLPAVAGAFYPAARERLFDAVLDCFERAVVEPLERPPRALIAPHAGYAFSGPVAASAFATLATRPLPERIILLGPSHFVAFRGLALSGASAFVTPLGDVAVDDEMWSTALTVANVRVNDDAHAEEHSLEVELPFLQLLARRAWPRRAVDSLSPIEARAIEPRILPLLVGRASAPEVAALLDAVWTNDVLLVVSSDLSHYLDHESAVQRDEETARSILSLDVGSIDGQRACGWRAIDGLLLAARRRGLSARLLDRRTSGDTSGGRARVVGYAAFALS
jgi:hypothetical protein